MKNKKGFMLNMVFVCILICTFIFSASEILGLHNEMKNMQSGAEYFIVYLGYFFVFISSGVFFASEISLYFNVRYFLYNSKRNVLYTTLNITMSMLSLVLITTVAFLSSDVLNVKLSEVLISILFIILVAIRIVYLVLRKTL